MNDKDFDEEYIDAILKKVDEMKAHNANLSEMLKKESPEIDFSPINNFMANIKSDFNFFNDPQIFKENFKKSINYIDNYFGIFLKSCQLMQKKKIRTNSLNHIQRDIEIFIQAIFLFITNLEQIIKSMKKSEKIDDDDKLLVEIESVLFNMSVQIHEIDELPFYKSNFLEVYLNYQPIAHSKSRMAAFKSVRGSGKSVCIPLILLTRMISEKGKTPFLVMTEPTKEKVDQKTVFFKSAIGQCVTVTNDVNQIIKLYDDENRAQKFALAIVTPRDAIFLILSIQNFLSHTRILVDEAHDQSLYTDALMSIIKSRKGEFSLPLHFSMASALIDEKQRFVVFFKKKIAFYELAKEQPFEVKSKNIANDGMQAITSFTNSVIQKMSRFKTSIRKGHILCFLPFKERCQMLKSSVISFFNQCIETPETRKVVILRTQKKENESIDDYFNHLRNDYELVKDEKSDVLYFVFIGLFENNESVDELAKIDFPQDLRNINKIICCPSSNDSLIDDVSVVIDSGLTKSTIFNSKIGLNILTENRTSQQSMNQKRGLLGRSMVGHYYYFGSENVREESVPSVCFSDLTKEILDLKGIDIHFEALNLPTEPNPVNLEYSLKLLKTIGALNNDLNITSYGRELLRLSSSNNSIISVYYANAIMNYRESFPTDLKKSAFFFAFYLSALISMSGSLVQESLAENLLILFDEQSDIITLMNCMQILLSLPDAENQKSIIESYGLSFSTFMLLKDILANEAKNIFEKDDVSILNEISIFVKTDNLKNLIDNFIIIYLSISPKWENYHTIQYNYVEDANNYEKRPSLIFSGCAELKVWKKAKDDKKKRHYSKVRVNQRPGWNGIMMPMKCFCLDICIYNDSRLIYGNIIHKFVYENKKESECTDILSLELPKKASNKWFVVLIEIYFAHEKLNIKPFTYVTYSKKKKKFKEHLFHISSSFEKCYLSFIPLDDNAKSKINNGVNECLKLLPYVPRSILVYRPKPRALIEISSIGTQNYDSLISTDSSGDFLRRRYIDYCLHHLDELALTRPEIRICCLFFNKECLLDDFNQKRLYIISSKNDKIFKDMPDIISIIEKQRKPRNKVLSSNVIAFDKYGLFVFPHNFIHPALLSYPGVMGSIMKWFSKCNYSVKYVGNKKFSMSLNDIMSLQKKIRTHKDKIKKQMNLQYVVVPVPSFVYEKAYLAIKEHPTWNYDKKFKVIITKNEEEAEVKDLINKIALEIKPDSNPEKITDTLCCCYVCNDSENPVLTNNSITIYYKDGKSYTNKMCRDCLALNLQNSTMAFFNNNRINQDSLDLISAKPNPIPSVPSFDINHGLENWPIIPIGQMVSVLINNDDELSSLISAWLNSIQEFTIRNLAKQQYTFCPTHPKLIYEINESDIKCKYCDDEFCYSCYGWHKHDFICEEKKNGKENRWNKRCPKCKRATIKSGGCNHITCPCGCHWCYVCGKGFHTPQECYDHMNEKHGGYY